MLFLIEIDDTLAEGHSGLGSNLWWYDWSWTEAEKEFLIALKLNPNSSMAHFGYGDFLGRMGRKEEGRAEKKRGAWKWCGPLWTPIRIITSPI